MRRTKVVVVVLLLLLLLLLLLMVAACSSGEPGPEAPPVGETATACAAEFCVEYPSSWTAEEGDTFLAFSHPLDPEQLLASVGQVDMEALVAAAGGTWPASAEDATSAFWSLIGGGEATVESITPDGAGVSSEGTLDGLRMWFLLVPTGAGDAVGIEVRAPNRSWAAHAEVFRSGLTISP